MDYLWVPIGWWITFTTICCISSLPLCCLFLAQLLVSIYSGKSVSFPSPFPLLPSPPPYFLLSFPLFFSLPLFCLFLSSFPTYLPLCYLSRSILSSFVSWIRAGDLPPHPPLSPSPLFSYFLPNLNQGGWIDYIAVFVWPRSGLFNPLFSSSPLLSSFPLISVFPPF